MVILWLISSQQTITGKELLDKLMSNYLKKGYFVQKKLMAIILVQI